jgi:predicted RecB family nuclease
MPKTSKTLSFDEKKHHYYLGKKRLPSVSEIMKPLTEIEMAKVPEYILDKARDRGTGVHEAIEDYILFDTISDEFADYVYQFMTFLIENDLQVVWCEKRLHSDIYAGTIDLLLKHAVNGLYLVDIKTTYKIAKYVSVQLSAYKDLLSYNGVSVSRCYILHLKKDSLNFKEIKGDELTEGHQKWKELLDEYQNEVHEHTKVD